MKNTKKIVISEFVLTIENMKQLEIAYPFYCEIIGGKNDFELIKDTLKYVLSQKKERVIIYCNPIEYKGSLTSEMYFLTKADYKTTKTRRMNFYEFKKTYLTSYKLINKAGFDSIAPNNLVLNKEYSCLDVFFWGGTKHYVMEMINEFPQDFEPVNQENVENDR